MQVLYQLSYGPVGGADTGWLENPAGPGAVSCAVGDYTAAGPRPGWPQTCRQTATSLPCTLTWSAGRTIGA